MKGRKRADRRLFTGATDTGNSLAAEVLTLALHVDGDKTNVNLSKLNKYVGETEKNLISAIATATRSNRILS